MLARVLSNPHDVPYERSQSSHVSILCILLWLSSRFPFPDVVLDSFMEICVFNDNLQESTGKVVVHSTSQLVFRKFVLWLLLVLWVRWDVVVQHLKLAVSFIKLRESIIFWILNTSKLFLWVNGALVMSFCFFLAVL